MRNKNIKIKTKKHKIVNIVLIIVFIAFVLTSILVGYQLYIRQNISKHIKNNITIEYGQIITLDDILKENDYKDIKVKPKLKGITKVGTHKITLTIDNKKFTVNIKIKDTTPPTLEVKDLTMFIDEEIPKAEDFVVALEDLSGAKLEDISVEKNSRRT